MFWREAIPSVVHRDEAGHETTVTLIAGQFDGQRAPAPPPNSWAARADADVAIWTLKMAPGARIRLPADQTVSSLSPLDLLDQYWKASHTEGAEALQQLAQEILSGEEESD